MGVYIWSSSKYTDSDVGVAFNIIEFEIELLYFKFYINSLYIQLCSPRVLILWSWVQCSPIHNFFLFNLVTAMHATLILCHHLKCNLWGRTLVCWYKSHRFQSLLGRKCWKILFTQNLCHILWKLITHTGWNVLSSSHFIWGLKLCHEKW